MHGTSSAMFAQEWSWSTCLPQGSITTSHSAALAHQAMAHESKALRPRNSTLRLRRPIAYPNSWVAMAGLISDHSESVWQRRQASNPRHCVDNWGLSLL